MILWQAWEECECAARMRMVTRTVWSLGCKRGPLNFSTKDSVLKQAKNKSIVNLPAMVAVALPLPTPGSAIVLWIVVHPQIWNLTKLGGIIILIINLRPCSRLSLIRVRTVEDSQALGNYLHLWCKADCQTQSLQVVQLIQISVTVHWRFSGEI